MPEHATIPPPRRSDLIIRPLGDDGRFVVKDPQAGTFFMLGVQECFLLACLDGQRDSREICEAFEKEFGEPLTEQDLEGFLQLARERRLLDANGSPGGEGSQPHLQSPPSDEHTEAAVDATSAAESPTSSADKSLRAADSTDGRTAQAGLAVKALRILFWRKKLVDPDRLFTWLEPKLRPLWTRGFLWISAASIVTAIVLMWLDREIFYSGFTRAQQWQTIVVCIALLLAVTVCHEFAHGLTCKHFGGSVHDMGFLLLFFLPAFYCNVSDAWLFREKWKRLLVTFAGSYFELFLWSLAVFVWRISATDTMINYVMWVLITLSGARVLFNFIPLIRLDGYYLLSDLLEIPNLRSRGIQYATGHLRSWLWGAPKPAKDPRGRALTIYGSISFVWSLLFLTAMTVGIGKLAYKFLGWPGVGLAVVAGGLPLFGLVRLTTAGEVKQMLAKRRGRASFWLLVLLAAGVGLFIVPMPDRVGGTFYVRPLQHAELRAPVAGFIRDVPHGEGDRLKKGDLVVRLEIPDLDTRIAQKQAELREAEAKLKLLEAGPRAEEVEEARNRVERARRWRDLAQEQLEADREIQKRTLAELDAQIEQRRAEMEFEKTMLESIRVLAAGGNVTDAELAEQRKRYEVSRAMLAQAEARRRVQELQGVRESEEELTMREHRLAEAEEALRLLTAGARPEEIDAQRSRIVRLEEDLKHLRSISEKLAIRSPIDGVVMTPRLREKIGNYVTEGALICIVEEPTALEVEIGVPEREAARLEKGQDVELKVLALPFHTFETTVEHISPTAFTTAAQAATTPSEHVPNRETLVTVRCPLHSAEDIARLRPGLTGYARIYCGWRPIGLLMAERSLRYVRTEFWW